MSKKIITISRQYGSGGRYVARMLAERLGYAFYDNELITLAAKESGFSESLFENIEKKSSYSLLYSLSTFGAPAGGVYGLSINDRAFIIQSDIIKQAAEKGPCVIVGRCADYILKERSDVINVFLHSDLESRTARAVKYYGIEEKKAKEHVQKTDRKRASYYNYFTGENWGDIKNYHISLDTDFIGIENCVDILEKYAKFFN